MVRKCITPSSRINSVSVKYFNFEDSGVWHHGTSTEISFEHSRGNSFDSFYWFTHVAIVGINLTCNQSVPTSPDHFGRFCWWRKREYLEETTDLQQYTPNSSRLSWQRWKVLTKLPNRLWVLTWHHWAMLSIVTQRTTCLTMQHHGKFSTILVSCIRLAWDANPGHSHMRRAF